MRRFLGIDPGVQGACAVLTANDGAPTVWTAPTRGRRRQYDIEGMLTILRGIAALPVDLAYLEAQSARPAQGVTSSFSIGYGFGIWTAALTAVGIPFAVIAPQTWRHEAGLPRGDKRLPKAALKHGVLLTARRRFPDAAIKLDEADAVMIAVAAYRTSPTPDDVAIA